MWFLLPSCPTELAPRPSLYSRPYRPFSQTPTEHSPTPPLHLGGAWRPRGGVSGLCIMGGRFASWCASFLTPWSRVHAPEPLWLLSSLKMVRLFRSQGAGTEEKQVSIHFHAPARCLTGSFKCSFWSTAHLALSNLFQPRVTCRGPWDEAVTPTNVLRRLLTSSSLGQRKARGQGHGHQRVGPGVWVHWKQHLCEGEK